MAEYIEREALMKNFCGYDLTKCVKYGNKNADQRHDSYSTMMMYEIADAIIDAPAADVVPVVHGRWVASGQCNHKPYRMRSSDHWTTYKCSKCGFSNGRRYNDNFCPNCGARMDGERRTDGKS